MSVRRIVFVCTGNICRSPIAEYLFKARIPQDSEWVAESAGTFAGSGSPASMAGIRTMQADGIDMTMHRSQPVTAEMIAQSDMLVVMTEGHRQDVLRIDPGASERVHLMLSFLPGGQGGDVGDPIGMSDDIYVHVRDEIDSAMPDLLLYIHEMFGADR